MTIARMLRIVVYAWGFVIGMYLGAILALQGALLR